jgi:hypothetical protein
MASIAPVDQTVSANRSFLHLSGLDERRRMEFRMVT